MNRLCVVLFAICITCSWAEPPPSSSYGLPEISSGYSYHTASAPHQSSHSSHNTNYVEQHVGHQTSEGLHLDPNLLHKIEQVLVQHENSGSNSGSFIISAPSAVYGAPQSSYGPPTHSHGWSHGSSKVVGIDFDHLRQSHQVAQYVARESYAPNYSGWSSGNAGYSSVSSLGWASAPSSSHGWTQQSTGWLEPRAPLIVSSSPGWNLVAPKLSSGWSKPSNKYGAPRW